MEMEMYTDYDAIEAIEGLPPAQPAHSGRRVYQAGYADGFEDGQSERKKGKWVGYDGDWLKTMCKCSECGAMIDINEKYRNFFCYHCGADMREETK